MASILRAPITHGVIGMSAHELLKSVTQLVITVVKYAAFVMSLFVLLSRLLFLELTFIVLDRQCCSSSTDEIGTSMVILKDISYVRYIDNVVFWKCILGEGSGSRYDQHFIRRLIYYAWYEYPEVELFVCAVTSSVLAFGCGVGFGSHTCSAYTLGSVCLCSNDADCMAGDVNLFLNEPDDRHVAEIEVMIAGEA